MSAANTSREPKKGVRRGPARGLIWPLRLLFAGLRLAAHSLGTGPARFFRWLQTNDGIAFTCLAAILLIIVGLWGAQRLIGIDAAPFTQVPVSASYVSAEPEQNPIVARIGRNDVLRLSEVAIFAVQEGRLAEGAPLTAQEAFDRGLVSAAVDQRLLARAAQASGLPTAPVVQTQLMTARNRILSSAYLEQVIAEAATEDKARALYQAQREEMRFGDEVRLRRITVSTVDQAVELSNLLREGASFAQLARDYSIEQESAARGGELGYFTHQQLPPSYADQVFAAALGEPLMPIKVGEDWVLLEVTGRRSVVPPSYASLEEELLEFLRLRAVSDTLERLREEEDVVVYESAAQSTATATTGLPE